MENGLKVKDRAAVLILDGDRTLLMRRVKGDEEYYVIPGGSVESGESLQEAAIREAKEETGLDVSLDQRLFTIENVARSEHYFLAAGFSGTLEILGPERERSSPENIYELEWIEVEKLDELDEISLKPPGLLSLLKDL